MFRLCRRASIKCSSNVLHLLKGLDLDCRKVPASNLIFARSRDAEEISAEIPALADACWPFHRAVIGRLGVRVVVCLGEDADKGAKARLSADDPAAGEFKETDWFVENNNRNWRSRVYRNDGRVAVVQLTHPSTAVWTNSDADTTELVLRALESG